MAAPTSKSPDKFTRYRAKKRALGLREIRMWVPDVRAPGFQERLDEQLRAVRDSEEEHDVMAWVEAVGSEVPFEPYDWPDGA